MYLWCHRPPHAARSGIYSRGNRLSCGLDQAVRWPVWNVAVLPCFSTSRDSPAACCDLPISGRLRSACPRLSVVSAVVLPARTWLDSNQRHFNHPSFRAALPTELQVHMVSRRRGGSTAGRRKGRRWRKARELLYSHALIFSYTLVFAHKTL